MIGPFVDYGGNPVLSISSKQEWGSIWTGSILRDGRDFVIFYSIEDLDDCTGKIWIARSKDGFHFVSDIDPAIVPSEDFDRYGCEYPRATKFGDVYYLTYGGNQKKYRTGSICLASSKDMVHWKKYGPIHQSLRDWNRGQIKDGVIVPQKINGKYVMYFSGETEPWKTSIGMAFSDDLVNWHEPKTKPIVLPRHDHFDSFGLEPGATPLVTDEGIVLAYNGWGKDLVRKVGALLLSKDNPGVVLERSHQPLVGSFRDWGRELGGTSNYSSSVGLARTNGRWLLYYGIAGKSICLAVSEGLSKSVSNTSFEEGERCYAEVMAPALKEARKIGEADIVVGVPFYNEADTISHVFDVVRKSLDKFYPDKKCVIVAAGARVGGEALRVINSVSLGNRIDKIAFLLDDERINGKGWSIRAIADIAYQLGADLAIVEADSKSRNRGGEIEGLALDWVYLLLEPIKTEGMDLVIPRFNRHYFENITSAEIACPLLAGIYNHSIRDPLGTMLGLSQKLLRIFLHDPRRLWDSNISDYGVDSWLITSAITSGAKICEAHLGVKLHKQSPAKQEMILRQHTKVLFDRILADKEWWRGGSKVVKPLPVFGVEKDHDPDIVEMSAPALMARYKKGFDEFHVLYKRVLPKEVYQHLEMLIGSDVGHFDFPAALWARIVYQYLLTYSFSTEFSKGDLLSSLIALSKGRSAAFVLEIQSLRFNLVSFLPKQADHLVSLEAERQIELQKENFIRLKPAFLEAWEEEEEAIRPPVPQVTYREFIPGVPLVVPSELIDPLGEVVIADTIYQSLFQQHRERFEWFVHQRLGVPRNAGSREIADAIKSFMHESEEEIDKLILPGDLSTEDGARDVVEAILGFFVSHDTLALSSEVISWILEQYPPVNLLTKLGRRTLAEVLDEYEPADVLALASWSEEKEHRDNIRNWLRSNARPEHFAPCHLKPIVVSHAQFPSLVELKESSALNKLTGRIVISNLGKGMGGEFPKLRYLTTIAKNAIEAEKLGEIFHRFADERKMFGERVINALDGHWGREPLSAHNLFESTHHQVFVQRLKELADNLASRSGQDKDYLKLSDHLRDIADSYHLALVLPDGMFVPCSAWTWASYSFKGGRGTPTPLSLHVERDWASRKFFEKYFEAAGGKKEEIDEEIVRLMGQGRESEDLAPILLGGEKEAENIVVRQIVTPGQLQAKEFVRFSNNPILLPIKEHWWESKYVLNAGVVRVGGKVHIVYRAFGDDDISRLGLAVSSDGIHMDERLDEPIFVPKARDEVRGCEDPRLTLIGDSIYMLYTAFGKYVAQIALASITANDFLNRRWENWRRHGMIFQDLPNKDAALFPELFDGNYVMLHRVDPNMWISLAPRLRSPWPKKDHKILSGPRSGLAWDSKKIGAGAQPIKTKYGWLLIYHGVDYAHVYRLGVMLVDLADPSRLLYRSPNPVLEPIEACEIGSADTCWVPNVVFTCGAVPREDKDMLEAEDDVLVYYGAADTVMCGAVATVGDLIPPEVRTASNHLHI